ncbi:MAG: glycosyltransferase family 2 protein [Conexibacter sp.]|nr:glycosyltransferase family 2 protein [Conexibacter sp.]
MPVPISVCVAVYRRHEAPNLTTLARDLPGALDGLDGELVVALNGIAAGDAGAPAGTRTVDLGVNRGVAPGWNAAAQQASGEVLVFANDDVALGARSLALLHAAAVSDDGVGVVGPVGTRWDIPAGEHREWVDTASLAPGALAECEVVSGFLFACRASVWRALGGFDEFYAPASWEEVDFCTAARAQGLRNYAVAGVDAPHEWGVSRRQMPWARVRYDGRSETWRSIHRRNRRHFLDKWREHPLAPVAA